MSSPVSSTSPKALRGRALRTTLRALAPEAHDETTRVDPAATTLDEEPPAPLPVSTVIETAPQSEGPRAMRPQELLAWRRAHGLG